MLALSHFALLAFFFSDNGIDATPLSILFYDSIKQHGLQCQNVQKPHCKPCAECQYTSTVNSAIMILSKGKGTVKTSGNTDKRQRTDCILCRGPSRNCIGHWPPETSRQKRKRPAPADQSKRETHHPKGQAHYSTVCPPL